jgi:abhydrolase domain-containing protein 17
LDTFRDVDLTLIHFFHALSHSALACLDIYPNINRIKKVSCPVMVIHGRLDQEVDSAHGYELHNAVPALYQRDPWWVPDRGHNDITDGPGKLGEYVRRLRAFLVSLDSV